MNTQALHRRGLRLSVIVVVYNMDREARRTLHSLSAAYQEGADPDDYEVIVVDNGSKVPFNGGDVAEFGRNFSYFYVHNATHSPARALNIGLTLARSDYVAFMIDGARIVTPGVIRYGLQLLSLFPRPLGMVLGFHIGPDFQPRSILQGYDRETEERLLESIGWPAEPYRLFEISSAHDPLDGWFNMLGESTCTFVHRDVLEEVGAFDEGFSSIAGGLLNIDVQSSIFKVPRVDVVSIVGEGAFHQLHGGATSSTPFPEIGAMLSTFTEEFRRVRGHDLAVERERTPHLIGHIPPPAIPFVHQFSRSAPNVPEIRTIQEQEKGIAWLRGEVENRDRRIRQLRAQVARLQASATAAGDHNASSIPSRSHQK